MSTTRKTVILAATVVCAAGLYLAALIWQGALSMPPVCAVVFAVMGALCFGFVAAAGYGEIKPRAPKPQKARPEPEYEPDHEPVARPHPPHPRPRAKQHNPDGTMILFDDDSDAPFPNGTSRLDDAPAEERGGGLLLRWYAGGETQGLKVYAFPACIGRSADCDIVVSESSISRRHAELRYENGEYFLTDLNSANGSFIDGVQVAGGARLTPGCVLTLGRVEITVSFITTY
jgi:hypothetical protein